MGGYTRLIAESSASPAPDNIQESTAPPETQEPAAPQVTESTSKSLAEIKNQAGKTVDSDALANAPLAYKIEDGSPQVLIIHTHTTESYYEQDRSVDETKNITAVGNVIDEKLKAGGIEAIHDVTVHDYPSYSGAYTRSAATAKSRLLQNPGIKVILDVHRDAVASADGSKLKLTADINGEKAAQVMFVVGTDAQLAHCNWQENLKLALKLQRAANELGSIIIEIGTNGNPLDEAKKGAELIGDVLVKVLSENK